MSLLNNLITQVAQNVLQGQNQATSQNQSSNGLGGLLGSVLGGQSQPQTQNNPLASMLGNVLGGQTNPQNQVLGQVLSSVLGNQANGKQALLVTLLPVALNWIQQNGGLSGALNKINQLGFGEQVSSWLSPNQPNQSLNPQDIQKLFADDEIQQVAEKTGCDRNQVCQGMAGLLPQIFDQLTPNGDQSTEKQANQEIGDILSQIGKFIR